VIAADTSVVVAALTGWHEGHDSASAAIAGGARLPAHCLVEAFSVLTRLPAPHRFEPRLAHDLLQATFGDALLTLAIAAHATLLGRLVEAGVSGGAAYDGLIGITAAHHDALLLSRDQRAASVYARLGVRFELVG
jgi:predicted nucleic acid-binding protein